MGMFSWLLLCVLALPAKAEAAPGPLEHEVAAVIDLFYNLEFDRALQASETLAARHPGHPVGPFYRSIVYYQRFLAEDPRRPETLHNFELNSRAALKAAADLRAASPAQGEYYLGIAHGFRGRVLAAQRRYLRAIPEALRAVKHLETALKLDPGIEDAYLGLGMYHYFTARIPAGAKPFAYLIGAGWGDREKGLEYLRRTAEKGGPARMEARSVLSSIYALEGRWPESEAYLRELTARYPRNPLYRLRLIYVLGRQTRWEELLEKSDPKGGWLRALPPELRDIALRPAQYRSVEALLALGRAQEAERLIGELEQLPQLGAGLRDFVLLRRANLLDLSGDPAQRKKALLIYKSLKNKEAARLARDWIKTPYPAGPKDGLMPWLGLETPS